MGTGKRNTPRRSNSCTPSTNSRRPWRRRTTPRNSCAQATAEMWAIQQDYDEFKQPDVDGDDRISRAEFNMYVKNYLANHPGLQEKDHLRFEDFDHDKDGFVSFTKYTQRTQRGPTSRRRRSADWRGVHRRARILTIFMPIIDRECIISQLSPQVEQ